MPYKVVKTAHGWRVKKNVRGRPRYFSKHDLTKKMANRQLRALYMRERMVGTAKRMRTAKRMGQKGHKTRKNN